MTKNFLIVQEGILHTYWCKYDKKGHNFQKFIISSLSDKILLMKKKIHEVSIEDFGSWEDFGWSNLTASPEIGRLKYVVIPVIGLYN